MIIDISHHQDPIKMNYDKLSRQIDFAIIRTQYGSKTLDKHYKTHHAEFKKRGIPTAAYAWVRGTSINDMEVEATDFYNRTKDLVPSFWFLDVEEKSMNDMKSGVSAYIKKLRDLGVKRIGIYIAHHLYKDFNLDLGEVDAVWIPHYGINDGKINSKPSYLCDIHQYTSSGRLEGYDGNLDLNRIISDKPLSYFTGIIDLPSDPAREVRNWAIKNNLVIDGYLSKQVTTDELITILYKYHNLGKVEIIPDEVVEVGGKSMYYKTPEGLEIIETDANNVYVGALPGTTLREFGIYGINGTWQDNANVKDPRSIWGLAINNNKIIGSNSFTNSPKGFKRGTIICYADWILEVKRVNSSIEINKPVKWAIGGGMLFPDYNPAIEGYTKENNADDVLRVAAHTGIGYKGNRIYMIVHNNCSMVAFKDMIGKLNLDGAIFLDGGGSTQMNYEGNKGIVSSRKLSHGVFIKEV